MAPWAVGHSVVIGCFRCQTTGRHLGGTLTIEQVSELPASALARLAEIDRTEHVTAAYRTVGQGLQRYSVDWHIKAWDESQIAAFKTALTAELEVGGSYLAVEVSGRLAGVAVLGNRRLGLSSALAELRFLHVSAEHRGHGIGTRLVEAAVERARRSGADGMYISATRTAPTVDFYLARGAFLAVPPDAERLAQEPVDIHLVLWWRSPT